MSPGVGVPSPAGRWYTTYLNHTLQTCCRGCANITMGHTFNNVSEINLSEETSTRFILPFLGRSTAQELYSYRFIPFTNVPHAFYVTKNLPSPISQAIEACLSLYRLIVVCLLAAVISGYVHILPIPWNCLIPAYKHVFFSLTRFLSGKVLISMIYSIQEIIANYILNFHEFTSVICSNNEAQTKSLSRIHIICNQDSLKRPDFFY